MIERSSFKSSEGEISYLDSKIGDRTLVFIHGGFGGPSVLDVFERNLGREKWRIVAPNLPGHGQSHSLPNKYRYEDIINSLGHFLEQFPRAIIVGHSFGGRIAWDLSQNTRLDIDKLVLLAPLLVKIDGGFIRMAKGIMKDYLVDTNFETNKGDRTEVFRNLRRWRDMKKVWEIIAGLPTITSLSASRPTIIIWGAHDSALTFTNYKQIKDKMVGVDLNILNGGHYTFFKAGDHWSYLRKFLYPSSNKS